MSMLIAIAALFGGAQAAPCTYAGKDEVVTVEACGWVGTDGDWHLRPEQLAKLRFDRYGLSALHLDQWYAVRRDGRMAPVMVFDNWAEDFSDGLVRSPLHGKIGFINRRLELAIPANYDGAYRFDHGRAAVCIGCRPVSDGEHGGYAGGVWRCIGTNGREIAVAKGASGPGICGVPRRKR